MSVSSLIREFHVAHKTLAKLLGIPYLFEQTNLPMILPSSGSMADNGALTLTTALDATYAECYMLLPANAIEAGSAAGAYFTQMSSTTVGTVFNNTYTSGKPSAPASPTAFVTTGPGAYTQSTSETTLLSFTLPGGALGTNGSLFYFPQYVLSSTANAKTPRLKIGGTNFGAASLSSIAQSLSPVTFRNKGAANRNVGNAATGFVTAAANLPVHGTIDTSTDQAMLVTAQLANAADYVVLLGAAFQINPSN